MSTVHFHDLKSKRMQSRSRMLSILAITCGYMLVELVTAIFSHSLALLADAGHMLTDVGALVLALIAIWFANKPATSEKNVWLLSQRDTGRFH